MRRDPEHLNRSLLTILGLVLVGLAAWGLTRSAGWIDAADPDEPLLAPSIERFVTRNSSWFWPTLLLASLIVALLGLLWLRAQLRLPRHANTDIVTRAADGTTTTRGDGLAAALEADVTASVDAVRSASARVSGDSEDADVDLRVEIDEDAEINVVRTQIETEVLPRFTRAASLRRTRTYLDLRLQPATRRVG